MALWVNRFRQADWENTRSAPLARSSLAQHRSSRRRMWTNSSFELQADRVALQPGSLALRWH